MTGTGYVGLVSEACFVDPVATSSASTRTRIKSRFFIPARLLSTSLGSTSSWRPRQGQDLSKPVGGADAVLIVAGTPSRHADLCYVYAAAEDIAQSLSGLTGW